MNEVRCPACDRCLFRAGQGEIEMEIKCGKCRETIRIEPGQMPRILNLETRAPESARVQALRGLSNGATYP